MNQENIIVTCIECGTKNRIAKKRVHEGPLCGKCRAPLTGANFHTGPVDVTDQTFNQEVLSHHDPVLVDCWAPWCGPCKMVAPLLDQLASEYSGRAKITKLNVDENPLISSQYGIQSIPTMLFFKNGKKVNTLVGALPKGEIEKHLLSIL